MKNDRGQVGKSTAGDRVKRAHKKSLADGNRSSLKSFAHKAMKDSSSDLNSDVKDWVDAKGGALNLKRSEKSITRIILEKQAKKAGQSKKK